MAGILETPGKTHAKPAGGGVPRYPATNHNIVIGLLGRSSVYCACWNRGDTDMKLRSFCAARMRKATNEACFNFWYAMLKRASDKD